MNAFLQAQAELIAAAAQTGPDMTEVVKGGGGARILPEGYAFVQLVEYVERGSQPQEFGGVAKEPAPEFQLGFALTGAAPDPADPTKLIPYNNDDGSPYLLRLFPMAMSRNEKARAFLLFKALNWKGVATHFAQLLGQKFLAKIITAKGKAADAKPYSTIDLKSFLPPLDPVTRAPYTIADAEDKLYRLFLWDHPTVEGWKALHIEGEFEAKDGKPARSKNFVQEDILGAVDFPGSPLEIMLSTSGIPYSRPVPKAVAAAPAAPQMAAPAAAPAAPAMVPAPVVAATPAPAAPATASPAPVAAVAASPSAPVAAPAAIVVPVAAPAPAEPPFAGGTPVAAPAVAAVPAMPAMPAMPLAA